MMEKICPVMGVNEETYTECLEEKCAIYLLVGVNKGVCALLSIAVDLAGLAERK